MSVSPGLVGPGPAGPRRAPNEVTFSQLATATERLTARVLDAFRRLGGAEARIAVAEARLMARLFAVDGHRKLGFATFGDCAREAIGVSPRHAADRRMLDRLFRERPNVEAAFLEGRISSCQALALKTVLTDENEENWIEACGDLTVSELRRAIRDARGPGAAAEPDDERPFRTISFTAPPSAAVAFDQAMETARRVLGSPAPRYRCVEAILAEVVPELAPPDDEDSDAPPLCRSPLDSTKPDASLSAATSRPFRVRPRARITLDLIDRELDGIEDLIDDRPSKGPADLVTRLRSLQTVSRPLRYLTGRLLGEIHDTGRLTLAEFAERHLRISERTAWNLLAESCLFENAAIAAAYGSGRIGIGQAVTIGRVAPSDRLELWIARAQRVTHRQFQREAEVLERLQDFFPILAARHPGPMPETKLEAALVRELGTRGWSSEEIRDELGRGLGRDAVRDSGATGAAPTDPGSTDPAEDPLTMRRLEILLEMLIVTAFDVVPTVQTFANAALPRKTIRFRAPVPIARWWRRAIRFLQNERPGLPDWACAVLLIREAVERWEIEAGRARLRERLVLERDGYLCQAPGCTQRRNLQVHHIRFRSRGGDGRPENKITLCFAHHQVLLHETGALAVRGNAPRHLRWRLGTLSLRGEHYDSIDN